MSQRTHRIRDLATRLGAELAIITLGVLVALWVDAWRQDRSAAEARVYLVASLANEVDVNAANLQEAIGWSEVQLTAMRRLGEISLGKAPQPSLDTLGLLLTHATSYSRARPVFGAYDAMVAAGTAELLPDPELAQRLARHRAELERGQGDESYAERAFERLVDVLREHGGWLAYMSPSVGTRIGFPLPEGKGDWSRILGDPRFLDAIYSRVLYEHNIVAFYQAQLTELRRTLELMDRWR